MNCVKLQSGYSVVKLAAAYTKGLTLMASWSSEASMECMLVEIFFSMEWHFFFMKYYIYKITVIQSDSPYVLMVINL